MGISCKERPSAAPGRRRVIAGRGEPAVIKISTTVDDTTVLPSGRINAGFMSGLHYFAYGIVSVVISFVSSR